jgi:hypothetical protein
MRTFLKNNPIHHRLHQLLHAQVVSSLTSIATGVEATHVKKIAKVLADVS